MSQISGRDGHDFPGLVEKGVPAIAALVGEIVAGLEGPDLVPLVVHELPNVLDRVQLGGARWQVPAMRSMPFFLIH